MTSSPTCAHCPHAKRTHQYGRGKCTARCSCARFLYRTSTQYAPIPRPASGPLTITADSTFSAYAQRAARPVQCDANDAAYQKLVTSLGTDRAAWRGLPPGDWTLPKVAQHLLSGWPEGVARMRDALGQVSAPAISDVRRRGVWADAGDVLSLDRLYGGNSETCWRTSRRQRGGPPPRVQVTVNACASYVVRPENAFWRGAAASALCEALTAAGYVVACDVVLAVRPYLADGSGEYAARVRVKDYDGVLNLGVLTAATAHTATLRCLFFALILNTAPARVSDGLGSAHSYDAADLKRLGWTDPNAVSLVVPGATVTPESAQAWIAGVVDSLGQRGAA